MKRTMYLIPLTTFFYFALAQNTLSGTVYLYRENSSNVPLEGVEIRVISGGSIITKKKGTYYFSFDNLISVVKLDPIKIGYEVINQEDVLSIDLHKKTEQNIYIDFEGNTRRRERELLDAALAKRVQLRNSYYRILEKGGKEAELLKLKLEKESGITFSDFETLKTFIIDKYGIDSKTLEAIVPSIVRLNLDHSNKELEKIREYTLKGMVDSVIRLLNLRETFKQVIIINSNIEALKIRSKTIKDITKASIPELLSSGYYRMVDSCYQILCSLDTSDLKILYEYAVFQSDYRNLLDEPLMLLRTIAQKIDNGDSQFVASVSFKLGELLCDEEDSSFISGWSSLEKALQIYRELSLLNSEIYLEKTASCLLTMGEILQNKDDLSGALKYFDEELEIRRKQAEKNHDKYDVDVSLSLKNAGYVLEKLKDTIGALIKYEEALKIDVELVETNSEKYELYVAGDQTVIGRLLRQTTDRGKVLQFSEQLTKIYRRLTIMNPTKLEYRENLADNLEAKATALHEQSKNLDAIKHYEEAINIYRALDSSKPSSVYKSSLAFIHILAGIALNSNNEKTAALKYHTNAWEIYKDLKVSTKSEFEIEHYEKNVAWNLIFMASILDDLGQSRERVLEYYKLSLIKYRWLDAKNAGKWKDIIASLLGDLGRLSFFNGAMNEAKGYWEEKLAIRRELAQVRSEINNSELASALTQVGLVFKNMQDLEGAKKCYTEALEILRQLSENFPDVYDFRLAAMYRNLGILYVDMNDKGAGKIFFNKSLIIFKVLCLKHPSIYNSDVEGILERIAKIR